MFKPEHGTLLYEMMKQTQPAEGTPIVELGSYFGDSAAHMAQRGQRLICIDTWLGSRFNHGPNPTWRKDLDGLYESFQAKLWPYREHVLPLRVDTITGLWTIKDHGLTPRFVYVDAGHEYWSVRADLETIKTLWPGVPVCGDDWSPGNDVDLALKAALIRFTGDPVSGIWRQTQ